MGIGHANDTHGSISEILVRAYPGMLAGGLGEAQAPGSAVASARSSSPTSMLPPLPARMSFPSALPQSTYTSSKRSGRRSNNDQFSSDTNNSTGVTATSRHSSCSATTRETASTWGFTPSMSLV